MTRNKGSKFLTSRLLLSIYTQTLPSVYKFDTKYEGHTCPSLCFSYQTVYGSTAFVGLGLFFSFLIYKQSVGLFRQRISPSQGRYLHT
jgi:hypothetical protein